MSARRGPAPDPDLARRELLSPTVPEASRLLLERVVPPPHRPPLLYSAMAANPEVLRQLIDGPVLGLRGLLYTGQITDADRELCILRVTARRGAEHEWGVHVAYFGGSSGLHPAHVRATVTGEEPDPAWTERQRAVLAISDAVADVRAFTDDEVVLVGEQLDDADRTELVALAAQYLAIASQVRVLGVPPEPGAPRFPSRDPVGLPVSDMGGTTGRRSDDDRIGETGGLPGPG